MVKFLCQFDPAQIKLLIFDLDGTLIDSRLDLIHSINAMLRHLGRPELPSEVVASYVGDGAPMLVRRALGDPDDEKLVQEALDFFLAYYRIHKLDFTHVYAGIKESLAALHASGRKMAVLSNKPVHPSRAIVEALGLRDFFVQVYGGNSFPTKKPDPQGAHTLLKETGHRAAETLIIGDSSIDVMTARNAGIHACGVIYGFAPHTLRESPPDVLIDAPSDLAALFG